MKFFVFICIIILSFSGFSQPMSKIIAEPSSVDEPASFPGGQNEMLMFIKKNLDYPAVDFSNTGSYHIRIIIRFVVEEDGSISDISILKGSPDCPVCENEAIRVIKAMPKWTPGKNGGKAVRSYYYIPVRLSF